MRLLVVIVCYRVPELTIDCLRSLMPELEAIPGAKVAVCENGTGGDSFARIQAAVDEARWGPRVILREVHPNRGFPGGNNVILEEAMGWSEPPENFLLLNADTIVRPGAVRRLLQTADEHPGAGIIGPRLEHPDGTPQTSCFRYHSPVSELINAAATGPITRLLGRFNVPLPVSEELIEPPWTSFACALLRRAVVEKIGVLDDGYYLYFDDVDYCRRARRGGWGVLHDSRARVVHLIGKSNPVEELGRLRQRRPRYYYESRSRYFAKFYGRAGLWSANLAWWAGRLVSLGRERVGSKPRHVCARAWLDIWSNALSPLTPPPYPVPARRGARNSN